MNNESFKDPIKEEKGNFETETSNKSPKHDSRKLHMILIASCATLGVAVIALSGVLISKAVNNHEGLAKQYLNNPIKIANYRNDQLISEQTIQYNKDWYRIGNTTVTYDESGKITRINEYKIKLDDKNRMIEGENILKNADGEIEEKDIQKCTFETDNKGTEYVENQYIEDGVVTMMYSSYDEYENTYTDEGKRVVDKGEDKRYINGKLVYKKIRSSDGIIANKGYDAFSKSEGKAFEYADDGTEILTGEMTTETEIISKSKTSLDCDYKHYNYSKTFEGGEWVEDKLLALGYARYNENDLEVLEEFRNYDVIDDAIILKSATKRTYEYDDFNRSVASVMYDLDINKMEETWNVSSVINNSYHGNDNKPFFVIRINCDKVTSADVTYREFDEYGRITYQESSIKSGTRPIDKNSAKYEYGDPVPLDPSEKENLQY